MKFSAADVSKFITKPRSDVRAMLVCGPNRPRVAETCTAIAKRLLGDDASGLTRLAEDEIKKDRARLADELVAQSLLGGPRLIRLRADGDGASEAILDAVKHLESDRPAAAFLLVEGGDLASKSKIRTAFQDAKRCAAIVFYEEDAADLAQFAAEALEGLALEPDAREAFLAALPGDRAAIRGEADKLALFAHDLGRPITAAEVRALAGAEAEGAIDAASLAALAGQAGPSILALETSDVAGVSAIKAMERRLIRLMEVQTAMHNGVSQQDAISRLRPQLFWKERDAFAAQLRRWPIAKLQVALDRTWRTEVAAKIAGAPQQLLAIRLFREIARLAER